MLPENTVSIFNALILIKNPNINYLFTSNFTILPKEINKNPKNLQFSIRKIPNAPWKDLDFFDQSFVRNNNGGGEEEGEPETR